MFNNLISRIGGIFSPQEKIASVQSAEATSSDAVVVQSKQYSARNPQSPREVASYSIISIQENDSPRVSPQDHENGLAEIQDVDDIQLYAPPIRRYGRICDCPKDPTYSMFCKKARQWYE